MQNPFVNGLQYLHYYFKIPIYLPRVRGGIVVKALRYKLAGGGFDFRWSLEFFSDIILPVSHYGPGVDSAPNRNESQEYFLGVKAAGA